jgi:hypothetical protein
MKSKQKGKLRPSEAAAAALLLTAVARPAWLLAVLCVRKVAELHGAAEEKFSEPFH